MIAALLDHIWQSTLFAGAACLLTLAFRQNGAAVRFWLWFAASMKRGCQWWFPRRASAKPTYGAST